jgi:selenocysteine lyase/cysteine desulfurase
VDRARNACARLLGAQKDEIAFLANTSDALAAVANAISWRYGDRIMISMPDFPSVIYPWISAKGRGVEIIPVPRRDGRLHVEDFEKALCPGTRIVVVGAVDFLTGYACDLEELGDFCRKRGLFFCVDAIQMLGALPVDVGRAGIHFLACGSHKWLMGPMGCGILYVSRDVRAEVKADRLGWKSVKDEEDFFAMQTDLKTGALGFEPGSLNLPGISGLGAAVELLFEAGIKGVSERIMELTESLIEGIRRAGFKVVSPLGPGERSGIVSFLPATEADHAAKCMFAEKIVVSERKGFIRVSPHFYNNGDDLERFFEAVKKLRKED